MQAWFERIGTLRCFVPVAGDQIMLSYNRAEDAEQAQRTFSAGSPGVLPPLVIEFVSDADMIRILEQTRMSAAIGASKPAMVEAGWGGGGAPAGIGSNAGGMWGAGLGTEDTHGFLPSDLFGGQ